MGLAFALAACSGTAATPAALATAAPAATVAGTSATAAPAATSAPSGSMMISAAKGGPKGSYVADAKGMALYLFTKDTGGVSACYDACAATWPPLLASGAAAVTAGDGVAGAIGTTDRKDGTKQVTYNGAPLYYFAADAKAGDIAGEGVGGVWFLVAP